MAELTTVGIARAWANAFRTDRTLIHWGQEHYGRPFSVSIGADMRRPPEEGDAPFLALFPDAVETAAERSRNRHSLGIVAGIVDEEWTEESGIREMRGLLRLDGLWPLLRRTMDLALPGAKPQEPAVEYELLQFPLVMLLISVTVDESLPIGRRA